MNLLPIVFYSSLGLTAASILLFSVIVFLRFRTDRSERSQREFEKTADALLVSYLAGETPLEAVLAPLRKNPRAAARLLARHWTELGPEGRSRLHPVYAAFPFLREELSSIVSHDWVTRLRATERLACLGDPGAVPALTKALGDEVLAVRFAAARSLCILGRSETVGQILSSLDLPGEMSRRRVAEVLSELGPLAEEPVLAILETPGLSETQLTVAVRTAGMLRSPRAISGLLALLGNESPEVRLNAVRALASIGDTSAVAPVSKLSEDSSWEVRNAVMQALGRLGALDWSHLLLKGLSDSSWWVRFSSAQGLYALGPQGVELLRDAATVHSDVFARDISRQVLQQHGILPISQEPLS